ncbi:MAG: OmpA family protein [Flavobacterium sp.]|nr:OmpA family protein [Flavobacterium sp.]
MKKCLIFICLIAISFAKAQRTQAFEVNFETASYHLSDAEVATINSYIASLTKGKQSYKVTIIGHTDNVGNLEYNTILSYNRAKEIAGFFQKKGFSESNISTIGKAYSEPIAANSTEIGKSKNRRVTVFITAEVPKVTDLGGLKLEEDSFTINAQKKEIVNYKSGSSITIPADAFIDENGNTIKGEVDLSYVEYRNPIDFILGNIPMDYEKEHFNSAGMYKILASKDGKPVSLREGKTIDIDFPLESKLPNLNFYQFDTIANKWTELSKLTVAKSEIKEEDLSDITTEWDTITTTVRYISTGQLIASNTYTKPNCWTFNNVIKDGIALASSDTSIIPDYLAEKEKRAENRIKMQQNYLNNKINNAKQNIEIKKYLKSLEAKIKRNNLKVKRIKQLIQTAGFHYNGDSKNRYIERQTRVNDSILARNKIFEDKMYKLKNPSVDSLTINPDQLYPYRFYAFWKSGSEFMSDNEKLMNIDQWFQYFDTHKPEMLNRYKSIDIEKYCTKLELEAAARQQKVTKANQNASAVTQKLQIAQLGIFNCDQIARLLEPITVNATYRDEKGASIKPLFIYLVDSRINGILRYDGYNNYSPEHFAYSPTSKNTLLAFDGNGNSYILNSAAFSKAFTGKTSVILTMKKIENIDNRDELTALF